VNCCECEELIAAATRDGRTLEAAAGHLAGCDTCREFARQAAAVAEALASWEAPAPDDPPAEAARAALVERLTALRQIPVAHQRRRSLVVIFEHPSLIAVAGAAAAAAGIAIAPGWVRVAAACWVGAAVLLVSLVLMHHGHRSTWEGEQ
jgi:predicted anti-sigma-YlaC factor YlaD